MEYIDPSKIFAVRDIYSKFSIDFIEKTLQDLSNKQLIKLTLNKKDIMKIKKLSILEYAKLVIHIDKYEYIYIDYYDNILTEYIKIGIYRESANHDREIYLEFNLEKFAEILSLFKDSKLDLYVYNNDYPVIIGGKDKIGLIAPLVKL